MKKYLLITLVLCFIALFSVVNIVNANLDVTEEQTAQAVNSLVTFKSSQFLSAVDSNDEILSITQETDKIENTDFYKVESENYLLKLDTDTKEVTGLYEKQASADFTSTSSKSDAESFIISKYSELNLPEDYDLVYLEKFDDFTWEANFQKKYGDVYNMYESVKVFFIPEKEEIVALTVFDEPFTKEFKTSITSSEAKETVTEELNLDSNIVSEELTIIKGNDFFENNSDEALYKAWILTTEDNEYIYVDASNGNIIGGDCINE